MPRQNPEIKQQLTNWHLKRVPFPSIPYVNYYSQDALINGSVFAKDLREYQLQQIRHDLLKEGFPQDVKRWNWIWAKKNMGNSLGMGKTALLAYICDRINKDFGNTFFQRTAKWMGIYVQVLPGTKTLDDVAAFALASICDTARGFSVEQRLLGRLRHRVTVQNQSKQYPAGLASIAWHRFLDDGWLIERSISREMLNADVEQLLSSNHVSAPVARAISTGGLREYLVSLNGNSHLIPVRQTLHNNALGILLNDIACVAKAADIDKVTIFLDDFYFIVRALTQTSREPLAQKIRKMVMDGPYEGVRQDIFNWIAVMHTQTAHTFQSAWGKVTMDVHAPLNGWNNSASVVLQGFTMEQGSILLREYLRYKPSRLPHAPNEVYPFTDDALDAIALATRKNDASFNDNAIVPRNLMGTAYEVFTRALEEKVQAPIGPDFVAHVLDGTPLPLQLPESDEMEDADTEEPQPSLACPCSCHDEEEDEGVHDVMAVISGPEKERHAVRHYCQNCNETVNLEPQSV